MTTLTDRLAETRHPMAVRWELVIDRHGRTRPEMRWEASPGSSDATTKPPLVPMAA